MLELKGELVFKIVAYHRAADAIGRSPVDLVSAYRAGDPPRIPGRRQGDQRQAGRAGDDRPPGLPRATAGRGPAAPGRAPADPRARAEVRPPAAPGARHRVARRPARRGRGRAPADRPGHVGADRGARARGPRPAGRSPAGADAPGPGRGARHGGHRRRWHGTPGVSSLEPAGSFRRRTRIDRRPGRAGGDERPGRADGRLHLAADGRFGDQQGDGEVRDPADPRSPGRPDGDAAGGGRNVPYPLHRLEGAQRPAAGHGPGPGLEPVGEGLPADRRGRRAADRRRVPSCGPSPTEAEAYAFLGLPFIEPELRENEGEIEAALAGQLPRLVSLSDLRGDLHSHSDWSDGRQPIEVIIGRRPGARPRLPGPDRPLAVARHRPRADPGSGRPAGAGDRRVERALRRRGGGRQRHRRPRRPRDSGSCTAASSRSGPTARSTSRTTCCRASTWSSPPSTSVAASPATT